jgi:hypothetical protein
VTIEHGYSVTMNLAPNPATTIVQVSMERLGEAGGDLLVFDAQGRLVYQQAVTMSQSNVRIDIGANGWATGLYFVTLRSEERMITKRLGVTRL